MEINVEELKKKKRLDEPVYLARAAGLVFDGAWVNLGIGVTSLISTYTPPDRIVHYHSENGLYNFGPALGMEDYKELGDFDFGDTPGLYLTPLPGVAFSDLMVAMLSIRKVDFSFLGFLQVSEKGDLANFTRVPVGQLDWRARQIANVGGGMDMVLRAKRVVAVGTHIGGKGEIKVLEKCTYPLTGAECVDTIITDLAVIEVTQDGLLLKEIASGWTVEEVQALTEPKLIIAPDLKEIAV